MGKEKDIKKNKIKYQTEEQKEIVRFVIVILVVLLSVGLIYLATRAFVTKDLFKAKDETAEVINPGKVNYDVAIMGEIFNRPYNEYYVAIYNKTDGKYISDMSSMVYLYSNKEKHLHIYTVDLSNKMNEGYYDPENVNVSAQSLADMKVGDITLLRVKNGKITKYIVDLDKMKAELGV